MRKPSEINVAVIYTTDYKFVLKVEDNGIGFNLGKKTNANQFIKRNWFEEYGKQGKTD